MLEFNELIDGKTVSDNEFSMLYNLVDTFVILRLTASKSPNAKLTFVDTFASHPDTVEINPGWKSAICFKWNIIQPRCCVRYSKREIVKCVVSVPKFCRHIQQWWWNISYIIP